MQWLWNVKLTIMLAAQGRQRKGDDEQNESISTDA